MRARGKGGQFHFETFMQSLILKSQNFRGALPLMKYNQFPVVEASSVIL
jgi:hypothetical protein